MNVVRKEEEERWEEEGGRFIIVGRPEALACFGQSERVAGGQKAWGRIVWKEWNGRGAASFWWDAASSLSFTLVEEIGCCSPLFPCEWSAEFPTSRRRAFYEAIWGVFRAILSAIAGKRLDL